MCLDVLEDGQGSLTSIQSVRVEDGQGSVTSIQSVFRCFRR